MAFPAPRAPPLAEQQQDCSSQLTQQLQQLAKQFSQNKVDIQLEEFQQIRRIQSMFEVDALLRSRRPLLDLGTWSPVPHTCTALTLTQTCADAASDTTNMKNMAEGFRNRHLGVLAANDTPRRYGRPAPQKVCLLQGMCVCRGAQRDFAFFWTAAKRVLTVRFLENPEQHSLYHSAVCLLWRARECGADSIVQVRMAYIPYFCGKPWQPVFWDVQPQEDEAHCFNEAFTEQAPPNDIFVTFEVRRTQCGEPAFRTPLQYVGGMDMQLRWEVLFLELSSRPAMSSRNRFRARFCPERALPVWDGSEAEMAKRQRRVARPARVEVQGDMVELDVLEQFLEGDEAEAEMQDELNHGEDGALLQQMVEAVDGDGQGEQDAAGPNVIMRQSSSSSSSSSSASSSSSSPQSSSRESMAVAGEADLAGREGERAGPENPVERQLHAQSFVWGAHGYFHFSYRPESDGNKAAYHVVCRWHQKTRNTACSKQLSFDAREEDLALRRLKVWCLSAPRCEGKAQHQAGRGLPNLSAEDAAKTHAQLDAAERDLPARER